MSGNSDLSDRLSDGALAEGDAAPESAEESVAGDEREPSEPTGQEAEVGSEPSGDDEPLREAESFESLRQERDEYIESLRRLQAEFENYRKRIGRRQADIVEQAAAGLVESLMPVLDACDAAMVQGAEAVGPVFAALLGTLEREGLTRMDPLNEPFDPELHEAVIHDPTPDEDQSGILVSEVMRPGYSWKGRVLRAAMVKVKG